MSTPANTAQDTRTRVGLFGVGLETYWPQFPGLKERLEGYMARIVGRLQEFGAEVVGTHDIYDADCDVFAPCATRLMYLPNRSLVVHIFLPVFHS